MPLSPVIVQKLGEVTIDDPVCLMGLRPFIGPVELLLSDNHVVILSACDGQTGWTVYSLRLPSADTLHSDMAALATSHQYSVSGTYRHLLTEAHAILYTDQFLSPSPLTPRKPVSPAYRASCQQLADHFLTSVLVLLTCSLLPQQSDGVRAPYTCESGSRAGPADYSPYTYVSCSPSCKHEFFEEGCSCSHSVR
ncbi:Hermansky-Pudlak syndrome 3 [Homalodisca vitripennis]|nr:Hermansky-Pudlak syndrome 3 [Homalodisca vitripennis]